MKKAMIVLGLVVTGVLVAVWNGSFVPSFAEESGAGGAAAGKTDREAKKACQANKRDQFKAAREEFQKRHQTISDKGKQCRDAVKADRDQLRKDREEKFKTIRETKC